MDFFKINHDTKSSDRPPCYKTKTNQEIFENPWAKPLGSSERTEISQISLFFFLKSQTPPFNTTACEITHRKVSTAEIRERIPHTWVCECNQYVTTSMDEFLRMECIWALRDESFSLTTSHFIGQCLSDGLASATAFQVPFHKSIFNHALGIFDYSITAQADLQIWKYWIFFLLWL